MVYLTSIYMRIRRITPSGNLMYRNVYGFKTEVNCYIDIHCGTSGYMMFTRRYIVVYAIIRSSVW
jgi:hypothetical protein